MLIIVMNLSWHHMKIHSVYLSLFGLAFSSNKSEAKHTTVCPHHYQQTPEVLFLFTLHDRALFICFYLWGDSRKADRAAESKQMEALVGCAKWGVHVVLRGFFNRVNPLRSYVSLFPRATHGTALTSFFGGGKETTFSTSRESELEMCVRSPPLSLFFLWFKTGHHILPGRKYIQLIRRAIEMKINHVHTHTHSSKQIHTQWPAHTHTHTKLVIGLFTFTISHRLHPYQL